MYGFPLTIYLLSGWLQSHYPNVDWFSHDAGHFLEMLFGWKMNPHFGPFHLLSFAFIFGGCGAISAGWKVLYDAQRRHALATSGIYAYVRHPQYVGFILVMFGFLLQWPTLLTLAMSPVLVVMYVHLARLKSTKRFRNSAMRIGLIWRRCPASFRVRIRPSHGSQPQMANIRTAARLDLDPRQGRDEWNTLHRSRL
jgi:protein-S-isoprenylcysteine O-methyltransferase Ste14